MPVTDAAPTPPGAPRRLAVPWTVRVADWSARHAWPVFALWFVGTIGLFIGSLLAGGTNAEEAVSNDGQSKYEAGRAFDVFGEANAGAVQEPPSQQFLLVVSSPDATVDDPSFATAIADISARLTAVQRTDGASGPVLEKLVDPTTAPPEAGLVSPDRTTVRLAARVPGDGEEVLRRLAPMTDQVVAIRAAHPTLQIHALNSAMANDEIQEMINGGLDSSLRLTIPLTFFILLVAFGAVVAAVVPMILAVTALLAAFGILGLYSQVVTPVSPYASQLIVLIGLAVAVDYSLFMVTRFRTERRHGRDRLAAIHVASSTAGRAVFFSGLAVMISIGGLFLLDDPLFRSMAVGTISVVLVAVIGSLTFLPATLAILGDRVNRFRVPLIGRDREEGSGIWARVVRAVMRRPIIAAVGTAAILIVMASPLTRLHMGQADFDAFPDALDSVQAVNVLNEKWPQGTSLRLEVVITAADEEPTKAAIDRFSEEVLALDRISEPKETTIASNGKVAYVSYLMAGGPNDIANQDIVRQIRSSIVPATFGAVPNARVYVSGDAAYTLDIVNFYVAGMPLIMAFVLTLSFLLLLVAFRSVVIPIKAILLNLLSTGAAYGVLVFVFQYGNGADIIGFKPGPIEAFIPVFIFTILFGLSMDYHVFILTRIKEARDRGLGTNEAVARGIAITSGTVTSAAAIMVVVFSVFVTLELTIIKQLGLGLAVAVFLDATVVRSILLPATMRLLGEWNWWLPSWLGWLPHVTIEGESDEPEVAPAGA